MLCETITANAGVSIAKVLKIHAAKVSRRLVQFLLTTEDHPNAQVDFWTPIYVSIRAEFFRINICMIEKLLQHMCVYWPILRSTRIQIPYRSKIQRHTKQP